MEELIRQNKIIFVAKESTFLPKKKTTLAIGYDCRIDLSEGIEESSEYGIQKFFTKDGVLYTTKDCVYKFSLGFKLYVPLPIKAIIRPRSSTVHRFGLIFVDSGVIDNDYFDTVCFSCYAIRGLVPITSQERIAQLLFFDTYGKEEIETIIDEEIYNNFKQIMKNYIQTNREGGYGSTNNEMNKIYCPHCKSEMKSEMLLMKQWTGRKYESYYQNCFVCPKCGYIIPKT